MQGLKGPEAQLRLPELGSNAEGGGQRGAVPIPSERKMKRERGAAVREMKGARGETSLVIRAKEGGLSLPAIRVC